MRSLSKLLVASVLSLGACVVTPVRSTGPGGPPPPPDEHHHERGARLVGTVTDARTHQPIAQVAVDIYTAANHSSHVSGHTDAAGHYETPEVPPGDYAVGVRRNGYGAMGKDHVDLRGGDTQLDIALDPQ